MSRLWNNPVLANLTFAIVLLMGSLAYLQLPREQDPTINFNWISIVTALPGASAVDVDAQITQVLEDALDGLTDVRFVSSTSREGLSDILVRFNDIDARTFDKRVNDLRREVQNATRDLPPEADTPQIIEITTANAYPSATVVLTGPADDETLRRAAVALGEDLRRLPGVADLNVVGTQKPELQVIVDAHRAAQFGLTPAQVADTLASRYRDVAAGTVTVNDQSWLVRFVGKQADLAALAQWPIASAAGEVPLSAVATIQRGQAPATAHVRFNGQPTVLFGVLKRDSAHLLNLVAAINDFVADYNRRQAQSGLRLHLVDDQTPITRQALTLMESNALWGLALVLFVSWLFLGSAMAVLLSLGIPFALAGTFWLLHTGGFTLNVTVLLGVVIVLGMLVDDAVVVVEAIYQRLSQGVEAAAACREGVAEVAWPVLSSVLTTMAAFLPLMLLPGILGQFMLMVPLVVTVALAVSLVEAFWMLPAHITAAGLRLNPRARIQRLRTAGLRFIQRRYLRVLLAGLRYPLGALVILLGLFGGTGYAVTVGGLKFDFFAADPLQIFYVNLRLPVGTPLDTTLNGAQQLTDHLRPTFAPGELRGLVTYAGQAFTQTAPVFGDHVAQLLVGLNPERSGARDGVGGRTVDDLIAAVRTRLEHYDGPGEVDVLRLAGGPPSGQPISVKVRGDDIEELRAAVAALKAALAALPGLVDITDDDTQGRQTLTLRLDGDAARRLGVDPQVIARHVALLVDGQVVAQVAVEGETVDVRVKGTASDWRTPQQWLDREWRLPNGDAVPLGTLLRAEIGPTEGNLRRYNFRRTITVEANIDRARTDTVTANQAIQTQWREGLAAQFPGVNLDFSGELDDINDSVNALGSLFLFGLGLIYLILGTQFRSYFQPLLILLAVPMALVGVLWGLLISQSPVSLYTLYGAVALAGIAVNAAIVLIDGTNRRREAGYSPLHAAVYAAKRRIIPVLITSLTTIASLFALAAGWGGYSLIWGPMATAIVWGIGFSTLLTLGFMPLFYVWLFGRRRRPLGAKRPVASGVTRELV